MKTQKSGGNIPTGDFLYAVNFLAIANLVSFQLSV